MLNLSAENLIVLGCFIVFILTILLCLFKKQKSVLKIQKKAFEVEKENLKQEWIKTLDAKDAKIKSLDDLSKRLNGDIKSLENKLKYAEIANSSIKDKSLLCQELQEKIDQMKKESDEILNSDKAKLQNDYCETQDLNKKLQTQNKNLESNVANLNAELEKRNFDISVLKDKFINSENGLKRKSEEVERIEKELRKASASSEELQKQLDKALKENKSLKDEIDDLNDDYDKLDDKFKKQKKEMSSLNDDLEKSRREEKKKTEKIAEISEKLNGTEADLSNKKKALTFVQEVLSAKENPDNITKEHRKVINKINSFLNDSLFGLMKLSNPSNKTDTEIENLKKEFDVWQNLEKKHWLRNKRTIAFVGEFSAGKTAIVNTILLQNDKNAIPLPENSKATTAIPTYISNTSGRPSFTFLTPNNQLKTMSETTFKMVNKEVLENVKGTSSLIKYFVTSYNNKALSDLSILDTPGFDSNDPEDAMRTIEVINECDALFWVIDVNKGELNKTSIKTIKNNLLRPLFIVINKVDTVNPQGVENTEMKIKRTLRDNDILYEKIIRFSKKEKTTELIRLLNSVNKARVEVDAIESIKRVLDSYKQGIHSEIEQYKSQIEYARIEGEKTSSIFTQTMYELIRKCDQVSKMPQRESRFLGFGDDVYSMSLSRFSEFDSNLKKISEISKTSKELYEKRMEIENKIAIRSKEFREKIQLENKWDDLISIFESYVREFNSTIG